MRIIWEDPRRRLKLTDITVARTIPASAKKVFDVWIDPKSPGGPWLGAERVILNPVVDGLFYFAVKHEARTWPSSPSCSRVFDRDKNWQEAFRDETYGGPSYGATFSDGGRLVTSSLDGKVRFYDRSFKLAATQEALSGRYPTRLAFRPDGKVLAIGYGDKPAGDLLGGHSLARLPGPNLDDLHNGNLFSVTWSADG
jgi:WD40 repeat protein